MSAEHPAAQSHTDSTDLHTCGVSAAKGLSKDIERSSAATAPGRTPTERQFEILMQLGSGAVLLTGRKREVDPLLRHGWVTADHGYAWVRITAAGLHALARAVEKYGLPEMTRGKRYAKVCAECGREWRPKCRCGGQSYRFEHEEVERAAA